MRFTRMPQQDVMQARTRQEIEMTSDDTTGSAGLQIDIGRRAALGAVAAIGAVGAVPALGARSAHNATPETASLTMDRAIVAGDRNTLTGLIAPDFLWVRGGGVRTDKAAFLAGLRTPASRSHPLRPAKLAGSSRATWRCSAP